MTTTTLATTLSSCFPEGKKDQPKDDELHAGRGQGPLRSLVREIHRSHLRHRAKGIQSDRSDLSLSKRWGVIHAEYSKFQGVIREYPKKAN
jgi:hypothetical protein